MTKIYPRNMKGKFPHWVFHSYFYLWKATRLQQCEFQNLGPRTDSLNSQKQISPLRYVRFVKDAFPQKVSMLLKSCEEKSKVNISIGGSQICQTFQTFAHGTLSPTYTFINTTKNTADISKGPPRPPKRSAASHFVKGPACPLTFNLSYPHKSKQTLENVLIE